MKIEIRNGFTTKQCKYSLINYIGKCVLTTLGAYTFNLYNLSLS